MPRKTQTSYEFAVACGVEGRFEELANAVREAIATLAGVEPQAIRSVDRFDAELLHYDFWGSLDSIAVVSELEAHLGISLEDSAAQRIVDPESRPGYTVAEFVHNVAGVVGDQWLKEAKRTQEKGEQ